MATFDVSATETFLPMQLIYTAKTKHVFKIMNFHVVSRHVHRSFSIEIFSAWSQPLDLSDNKAPKAYVSEKYNTWIANKISK